MTIYIFKMVFCSAILLLFYHLFLEKEKMHRFNRFYLFFSIILSFIIPYITIKSGTTIPHVPHAITVANNSLENVFVPLPATFKSDKKPNYLLIFYLVIAASLLLKFIKNTFSLLYRTRRNTTLSYCNAKLVLIDDRIMPHTYLHYIFLNKEDYEKDFIEPEILKHELTHVTQKHTVDILLAELAIVVAWFNPFLYLYKKSIKLNHEFLADSKVLRTLPDPSSYQLLLLNKLKEPNIGSLTSQFNYLITKKRLIMMTRTTSLITAIVKQSAVMILVAVTIFSFGLQTAAQEMPKVQGIAKETESTKEGASEALLKEYDEIITKYKNKIPQGTWWNFFSRQISEQDRSRMETIFKQMSKDQQEKQTILFREPLPAMKKVTPKSDEYEAWKDAKVYGVWINNKRVPNEELNKYSNTSFAHVFVSKLTKNAINYGKHYYQVDLMTPDKYEQYYQETNSNKKSLMMFRVEGKFLLYK